MLSEQEYVDQCGLACPFCQSERLDWGNTQVEATLAFQEVYCHDCGAEWEDVYEMVGYQVVTKPDPSILATLEKPEA